MITFLLLLYNARLCYFFRSQALVREQQKAQEVNRLQEAINKILKEAGKRTREEVRMTVSNRRQAFLVSPENDKTYLAKVVFFFFFVF